MSEPSIPEMAAKAKAKVDAEKAQEALKEILARKLYETHIDPEVYKDMTGRDKPAWRIEGLPWDKFPELEIAEHERDDYRWQASKLLEDPQLKIELV